MTKQNTQRKKKQRIWTKPIRKSSMGPCTTWWQTVGQHCVVNKQRTSSYKQADSHLRFLNAFWKQWKYNKGRTTACDCQVPSTNSGHSPLVTTKFPTQHQQICRWQQLPAPCNPSSKGGKTNNQDYGRYPSYQDPAQEQTQQELTIKGPKHQEIICYHHAVAGFQTKAMWLWAIKAGFFVTWPMLTTAAVNKFFLEMDEIQKSHMQQNHQGVWLTKEAQQEEDQHIIHIPQQRTQEITHYVHQPRRTVPNCIQLGQPVNHGTVQNRWHSNPYEDHEKHDTRGNVQNIWTTHSTTPELQHHDKEAHTWQWSIRVEYYNCLQAIKEEGIKYQQVPPNMHQKNAGKKAISTLKITSSQSWQGWTGPFLCIYGIGSCHKHKTLSTCCGKQTLHPQSWHMHTCMGSMITTKCP